MVHEVVVEVVVVHIGVSLSSEVVVSGNGVLWRGVGEASKTKVCSKAVVFDAEVGVIDRALVAVGSMVTSDGGTSDSFFESCRSRAMSESLAQVYAPSVSVQSL